MSWAELKGEILHCVSCKKALKIDWEDHKYYQISDQSILEQANLRMEYRSSSPEDDFLYYHREAVCRECLEGAEDAYILEGDEPLLEMAAHIQEAAAAFDDLQKRYADEFFRLGDPDRIRELAGRTDPHGTPAKRLKDLKNRLTSMVCTEYEKSPEFALHKERLEAVLSDCKRRAEQLASYDLWLEISGTEYRSLNPYIETEDSVAFPASDEPDTGFYGSCASAQEIAANLEETCRKQMADRDELTKAAKLRLRDMPAFLRDKGIDPDTLFSGGRSGSWDNEPLL